MKTIGIYHQVDIEVLEHAAQLREKKSLSPEVKRELALTARAIGISEKTAIRRTVPAKTAWNNPKSRVVDKAAHIFESVSDEEKKALHLAVLVRAYPIFLDVLDQAGARVRLQSDIRQVSIRDRLIRQYGSKANVQQGVQKVLQTLVSWGSLEKMAKAGVYRPRRPATLSARVAELLVAAVLEARGRDAYPTDEARQDPALFLFTIPRDYAGHGILTEFRDGSGRRYVERLP